jgi:hypothetical protein
MEKKERDKKKITKEITHEQQQKKREAVTHFQIVTLQPPGGVAHQSICDAHRDA